MSEFLQMMIPVILLCSVKAVYDYHIISKGLPIPHFVEWLAWACAFLIIDWLFGIRLLRVLPLQAALSWILFDLLLNKLRGLSWNYVGKTAGLDRIFGLFANSEMIMLITKGVVLIATTIFYFLV